MNTILASVLIFLASVIGSPVQPSQPVSQPVSVECMEDMPCWDSATMGQILPRLSDSELDAWDRVSALGIVPASSDWALEYVETITYTPTSFPVGYFPINSATADDSTHVMHWVHLSHA